MQTPAAHDIFISYSIKDKAAAEVVCATLERAGLRCWMAPRDVLAGVNWGSAILGAINASRAMVLVFSSHANQSPHVLREVERAVHHGVPIIPLRIENVPPADALEFFISVQHWLEAADGPLESHLDKLIATLHRLLAQSPPPPAPTPPATKPVLPPPLPPAFRPRKRWILPAAFLIMAVFLGLIALITWRMARKHLQITPNIPAQPATAPTTQPPATEPVSQKPRIELFPLPQLPADWDARFQSDPPADTELDWRELRSQPGHFHVLMPGKPKPDHSSLNTEVGVVDMYYWIATQAPFSFVTMYADYPPSSVKELDPQKLLANARDGMVNNIGGTLLSDENIHLNDHPGREIRMSVQNGDMLGQARLFLVRNRLFILICITDRQHGFSPAIHKFLNSFTLDEGDGR